MTTASLTPVLHVEDSPTDALLIREELKEFRQFHLTHVDRLEEALRVLATGQFAVVLLDLGLPDSQGLDTLLRFHREAPQVPVVVMTSYQDTELGLRAVQAGAQDYLVKGQTSEYLLDRTLQYAIERNLTKEALRERGLLASLTADVGLALTRSDTLRDMLQRCVASLVKNLGAAFARVWTLNKAENVLELQAAAGKYTAHDGPHYRVPVGESKVGVIAAERKPLQTNDVAHDARVADAEWARREGMVAFGGYPLLVDDQLVGVMTLFVRKALTDATFQALASVASQIALGIERKGKEEAFQLRDRAIQAVTQGILITDPNQTDNPIVYASPSFLQLTGYTAAEAIGRNCRFLQGKNTAAAEVASVREAIREQRPCTVELLNYRKDGTPFWNELSISPVTDEHGLVTHFVGVQTDVTQRRQLEDQFRQAQKMEAVGRLAGGVAHDFNNLLTIINGYSEMVMGRLVAGDQGRQMLQQVVAAGDRAAGLTRQLLAFSRKAIVEPKILDLKAVVADVDKMLRRVIGEDIQMTIVSDPEVGAVKADPGQIEQVLLNLAINARDAMPKGGQLTIEVRNVVLEESYTRAHLDAHAGPHVLLAVSDNGCGMDDATKARIFEPFFTTKGEGGTGLGLATVHGIVKQSGGHVLVYSEVGHGTTFKIYLPNVSQKLTPAKSDQRLKVLKRGTETVLFVEDECAVRALSRHVLQNFGYTVLEAADGVEALRIAGRHPGGIDLLVTDVVMPRMGGPELAEQLAAIRNGVKVLYLSGYTDDAVVRHGILQAHVAFLQKPFSPASLIVKVREVLDSV